MKNVGVETVYFYEFLKHASVEANLLPV